MNNQSTPAPTAQNEDQLDTHAPSTEPVNTLAQEFGKEAGVRIGSALAEEIHEDPEVRKAAATGAGVGVGVVVGLALVALATQ